MLATYILGSLALIVKPGPDFLCTIATALSEGKARAATLMSGLVLGCWLWIALLAAGVAAFFAAHPGVMAAIQLAGVAYIGWLAVGAFRDAARTFRSGAPDPLRGAAGSGWSLVRRGVLMSMSNPLTILFFLAFLPNFTREGSALSPAAQTLLLGTLFCAMVPFVYFPAILAADFFRAKIVSSAKATGWLKLVSAAMLAAVVAILAFNLAAGFRNMI